jgi:hypothetical protein
LRIFKSNAFGKIKQSTAHNQGAPAKSAQNASDAPGEV